ncbi:MAG TPA: hypothetical protein VJS64_05680, partial [Pyrinomonadaceae bacterium]|nr:hypothetical protein [Pyrinomonadaceae bacterium]
WYKPIMYTLTPGEWYLCYSCKRCHARQVLFPDLSKGEAEVKATYIVTCQKCGHKDGYEPAEVERYHHPEDAAVIHLAS